MNKDPFVEIVIESSQPATQGQRISPLGLDPVREKFYDMRSLAPNNPDDWHEAQLFYRQGKFMQDFDDDYDHYEPLRLYSPCYQRMGYDHLRTFFTWRTKARRGELSKTSLSYVFLYVYELISGIGSKGPADGLNKLLTLWKVYREAYPMLDSYIADWLKDYHIYYNLPHSFGEFIETHKLGNHYKDLTMFELQPNILEDWLAVGNYDITKSRFYSDDNQELMRIAFHAAIVEATKLFANLGKCIEDMFYYRNSAAPWRPFEGAIFYPWYTQPDKEVSISPQQVYVCRDNKWTARKLTPYKHKDELVGYFVKNMEQHLREIVGFKGSFRVNTKFVIAEDLIDSMGTSMTELSALFYTTAKRVYQELTRIVVKVDTQNLDRIREEAEVTQEKLVVEEKELSQHNKAAVNESAAHASPTDKNPWDAFKDALTPPELEALKIVLHNPDDIKAFADEKGIMLEILADGINEKAMDTVGDNILELSDTMVMYEDYVLEIEKLF